MTYVISDLHGDLAGFRSVLSQVKFCDDDILYVVGDIVDYGEDSMELLCEISMMPNAYCVAGDHDLLALRMLSGFDRMLKTGATPEAAFAADMQKWVGTMGGAPTLAGFRELDEDMREGVLDFLSELAYFEEVTVNDENFLMVHAGFRGFDPAREIEDYELEELTEEPVDVDWEYFEDKTLIVGHRPTYELPEGDAGRIYYGNGSISLDCGAVKGYPVGLLCLETGKEFYGHAEG